MSTLYINNRAVQRTLFRNYTARETDKYLQLKVVMQPTFGETNVVIEIAVLIEVMWVILLTSRYKFCGENTLLSRKWESRRKMALGTNRKCG